jgi:ABC-type sugar transport system ATPase subunit
MAEITLDNVTKTFKAGADVSSVPRRTKVGDKAVYDTQPVVQKGTIIKAMDHLTLHIPDGLTMAIVGPSGCGKSTLLRVVAGLTDYQGRVAYDGKDMQGIPPGDRRIGMVFQNYALYPHFYGQGNLSFFFRVNRAPDEETEERIRTTSEMMGFGFKALLKRKPGTLSGGQQQRLAIARALVRQPDLFLFDEPLSNLDAKLRARTRVEIKRLLHAFNITAIYVTHDQDEAMALGDQIAVMRAGRIEQVGTYQALRNNPANAFVAGFLGHPPMNLLQGRVTGGDLSLNGVRVKLPPPVAAAVREDQTVILGIRPGAARVPTARAPAGARDLVIESTIEVVEPDFGRRRQIVYVRTAPENGDLTFSVIAPQDMQMVPGYKTEVVFPADALYVFDGESEQRITPSDGQPKN